MSEARYTIKIWFNVRFDYWWNLDSLLLEDEWIGEELE